MVLVGRKVSNEEDAYEYTEKDVTEGYEMMESHDWNYKDAKAFSLYKRGMKREAKIKDFVEKNPGFEIMYNDFAKYNGPNGPRGRKPRLEDYLD